MTDEELTKELETVEAKLKSFAGNEKPDKKEKRQRHMLSLRKDTLVKIRLAREKGDKTQEFQQVAMYGLLTASEDKHPLFMHLARQRFGVNFF